MVSVLILLSVLTLNTLYNRFLKVCDKLLIDYNAYTLLFSLFYVILPNIVFLTTNKSPFTGNIDVMEQVAQYGIYFHVSLLMGMWMNPGSKSVNDDNFVFRRIELWKYFVIITLLSYVLIVLFLYAPALLEFHGNRKMLSALNSELIQEYKFAFVFMLLIYYVVFLSTSSRHGLKWILLLTPFIIFDIVSSGRFYIVMSLITYLVLRVRMGLKLDFKKIFVLLIMLLFYRSFTGAKFYWYSVVGEFIFTMGNSHLVLEYDVISLEFYEFILAILGRMLPLSLYSHFLDGWYHSYLISTSELNPLYAGLGGSVIAEALSLNSSLRIIYPWIIVLYSYFYHRLSWSSTRLKIFFQLTSIISLWQIFRFSLIENMLYPISLVIIFAWPRILKSQK